MNATLAEVEAKLRAAMNARRAEGIAIEAGATFRFFAGRLVSCCAIGSAIIDEHCGNYPFVSAARVLGVSVEEVVWIAHAFDGYKPGHSCDRPDAFDLGRRLRADYLERP